MTKIERFFITSCQTAHWERWECVRPAPSASRAQSACWAGVWALLPPARVSAVERWRGDSESGSRPQGASCLVFGGPCLTETMPHGPGRRDPGHLCPFASFPRSCWVPGPVFEWQPLLGPGPVRRTQMCPIVPEATLTSHQLWLLYQKCLLLVCSGRLCFKGPLLPCSVI